MPKAEDILKVARAEIGYTEGKNNSNKYGAEYGLNNQPYCVIWIWWLFRHANASHLFYGGGKVALCSALYNYHKSQAVSRNSLKAGDIVFFDFSGRQTDTSHVGIVESVSGTTITTIEGNTSSGASGSQSNGDGVYRRQRSINLVSKAYRPKYDESYTMTTVSLPELKKGDRGNAVRSLQMLLNALNFPCGEADGILGDNTEKGIKAFQSTNGCVVDGIVGKDTYSKLFG